MKTILNAFLDIKGIVHHEFVPEKQTASGAFCKEMVKRLIARVRRVRPEFQECESWYHLLHDSASDNFRALSPNFW